MDPQKTANILIAQQIAFDAMSATEQAQFVTELEFAITNKGFEFDPVLAPSIPRRKIKKASQGN